MQEVDLHTGKRKLGFIASERRGIQVMLSQIVNLTVCRQIKACGEAIV